MTTSHGLVTAIVVAGTASLVAGLARRSPVPESVVLVGAGVALSFLPGVPQIVFTPELVLGGLLPPLLRAGSGMVGRTRGERAGECGLLRRLHPVTEVIGRLRQLAPSEGFGGNDRSDAFQLVRKVASSVSPDLDCLLSAFRAACSRAESRSWASKMSGAANAVVMESI